MSSATPRRDLWRDGAAILALALATVVICWPLGLTNRILAGIDAFTYFTPYWSYRMEAFWQGVIPLWNPHLFSGAPFLANIQTAVLYPLHWPLSWLSAEQALVWSALLHVWMAAVFTYILARRSLGVTRLAAFAAALIFGLGGFTLARIENINQLNALAWLPALLWLYDESARNQVSRQLDWRYRNLAPARNQVSDRNLVSRILAFIGLTVVIALQLLAGHTQTTFINMVGLGLWALASAGRPLTRAWLRHLLPLLAVLPALALSAAQLLPTLELNGLGLRTGGLDYRTATSFSLRPQWLLQSFLPPYRGGLDAAFGSEGYAEFAVYIGIIGLALAAVGAWRVVRSTEGRRSAAMPALVLAFAGLFLAFGRYNPAYYVLWRLVPGFDLFRAPARWAALYALGAALLVAWGLDRAGAALERGGAKDTKNAKREGRQASRLAFFARAFASSRSKPMIVAILFVELALASRALPFTAATAPMATDLRNATAALLAATDDAPAPGRDRFLSLSDIRYDPGDLAELRALQADLLPAPAVERLVRAAKQVEVLAPNLPLFYRLPAVDGYDGGLLPLHRYVLLQGLFLDADNMTPDGRLAEQLDEIPDGRLLDLTGVRYVITDKQRDLWAGDVYYDLEQAAIILPGEKVEFDLQRYPAFSADALGVVSGARADGQLASATVIVGDAQGNSFELALPPSGPISDPPQPQIVSLPQSVTPAVVNIANTGATPLALHGLSLIDSETGAHQSITVSPRNNFRRIHSGDVKIYERLNAPGRAWIVHGAVAAPDEIAAQALLADPAFDPRASVILEGASVNTAPAGPAFASERVAPVSYAAERVVYDAQLIAPGWLVMADAWYPGWTVTVDGAPADLLHANLLYRAVALPPGRRQVALTYAPSSWATGRAISLVTLAALALALSAATFLPRFTRFPR